MVDTQLCLLELPFDILTIQLQQIQFVSTSRNSLWQVVTACFCFTAGQVHQHDSQVFLLVPGA
jgi:hypothetical protein